MNFSKVFEALKNGEKIKLSHWTGYWQLENGKVMMHCKNGDVIDLQDSKDIVYTLSGIASDDWQIVDKDYNVSELVKTMQFGEAIRMMKQGKRVARLGWNGKSQYIELATCISYKGTNGEMVNCEHAAIGNKAIAFVGTSGVQMGWLASQADMLAEDWIIAE